MWPFPAKKKRPAPAAAAPQAPSASAVSDHRTAFILIALGGATLASFGIAAPHRARP